VPELAGDAPVIVVQDAPEESKLAPMVEQFDSHKIGELMHECLNALLEVSEVALDLVAQENLHAAIRELRPEFVQAPGRILEEALEGDPDSGL